MINSLDYRGPDDKGNEIFKVDKVQIGMAQARLAIIDLSSAGHQPMHYKSLSIVFNGEIYNYKEIKNELIKLGHLFQSNSDTEVILHAYSEWGIKSIDYFIGMFAIILLDREKNIVILINDRAGVKPLYFYTKDDIFLFASELKAFWKHPKFEPVIDTYSLKLYFENVHHGYIPAPYTIFENTKKMEQGTFIELNLQTRETKTKRYWDVNNYYNKPKIDLNYAESKSMLNNLFNSAFNYRMVSDVPVGVFLSGGYDSTVVTAILQKDRTERLKTFTIGFEDGNNEAPFARETAKYLGTDHTEFICTQKEAQSIIHDLPFYYDEPFADSSAIPTILVSQIARKQVTVALSADAGDEIFAGYTSYSTLKNNLDILNIVPSFLKSTIKPALHSISKCISDQNPKIKHKIEGMAIAMNKDRLSQAADLMRISNSMPVPFLENIFNTKQQRYSVLLNDLYLGFNNEIEIAMASDYRFYLQNDILTKVDRATMSVSLEGREPLLDHRIVEFAAQLPIEYKFDGKISKKILKDIVHDLIPKKMMDRPKTGFSLPINKWLQSDLSYLIDHYLNEDAIGQSGLFNKSFIMLQVSLFKRNNLHYTPFIWKLLMFQMWYERWMK